MVRTSSQGKQVCGMINLQGFWGVNSDTRTDFFHACLTVMPMNIRKNSGLNSL